MQFDRFRFERLTAVKNSVKKNGPKNEKNFDKTRYTYKNSIWTRNINMMSDLEWLTIKVQIDNLAKEF